MLLPLFYFLAVLHGEVQTEYKCQNKNEIITRCLRKSSKKHFCQTTFLGIKTSIISFSNRTNSYFVRKYIKEMHFNCKIKHLLILKILKWRFWPLIKKNNLSDTPWHIFCSYTRNVKFYLKYIYS